MKRKRKRPATKTKAKGRRREWQTRDWYIEHYLHACRVVKAGGSLGEADLVIVPLAGASELVMAQVKSNDWPSPAERLTLEELGKMLPGIAYPVIEIVRWDDYSRKGPRRLRLSADGWHVMRGDVMGEVQLERQGERP